jgi:CheY-like chemotaxis protein
VERSFQQVAEEKGLAFSVEFGPELPASITSDDMRLKQVLRNLLSNAFKFTERGSVLLRVAAVPGAARTWDSTQLTRASEVVAFSVVDSGIGVPLEKQRIIFEAFQQADGSTSRKFGGTGLGLSISREIAKLLGGELEVRSEPGKGSIFTLYVPRLYTPRSAPPELTGRPSIRLLKEQNSEAETVPVYVAETPALPDDRATLKSGDRVLLIIEDDPAFAKTLLDLARERNFAGIVASTGTQAMELAKSLKPDGITLDLGLPDMDGWVLLDRFKHTPETRHIPVHIISGDDNPQRGLQQGALAFLQKPVTRGDLESVLDKLETFLERRVKRLLVVEDDDTQRQSIIELIGSDDVETVAVASAEEALEALSENICDCVVLDLTLPQMSGIELIQHIKTDPRLEHLPIIVYTGRELTAEEHTELRRLTDTIIIKDVRSPERLLDETALFLHRVSERLPQKQKDMLHRLSQEAPDLAGTRVLIVDDDLRNIFATTALLERHDMQVKYAENGQQALDKLSGEEFDIVLMDVMMPEMDGYEATRRIRAQPELVKLPIIALTAKAMKGDRDKCIAAGASDYITKPVDAEQLLSLMRVWLYR